MKFSSAIALGLVAAATAAPTTPYVVHEKRGGDLESWAPAVKARGSAVVPVSIGLTQRNLENGHDFLMDVSEPTSRNYGKHWTAEQVHTLLPVAKIGGNPNSTYRSLRRLPLPPSPLTLSGHGLLRAASTRTE